MTIRKFFVFYLYSLRYVNSEFSSSGASFNVGYSDIKIFFPFSRFSTVTKINLNFEINKKSQMNSIELCEKKVRVPPCYILQYFKYSCLNYGGGIFGLPFFRYKIALKTQLFCKYELSQITIA